MKTTKRKYDKKLVSRLEDREQFLLSRLAEEWERVEKQAKKEAIVRRTKDAATMLGKDVLTLLAIGGVLVAGPIAGSIVGIARSGFSKHRAFYNDRAFHDTRRYLQEHEFIHATPKGGNVFEMTLAPHGRRFILQYAFRGLKLRKPEKWDGDWRIVIFDIKNRQKWARDRFRMKLKELGFYLLQESVFVTPYPCDEEIAFLASVFGISHNIHNIKTKQLSNDGELRKVFHV